MGNKILYRKINSLINKMCFYLDWNRFHRKTKLVNGLADKQLVYISGNKSHIKINIIHFSFLCSLVNMRYWCILKMPDDVECKNGMASLGTTKMDCNNYQ